MTTDRITLHFRSRAQFETAVGVLAQDHGLTSDPARLIADLREVSEPESPRAPYSVALGAAVQAVRQAAKERRKKPHRKTQRWT